MKEKIEQLAKGKFQYTIPEIILSQSEIELEIEEGKYAKGSFVLKNNQDVPMKGVIYTSSTLIRLEEDKFFDKENLVHYEINGKDMNAGESLLGEIQIVSSCGEVTIPVKAYAKMPYCITSLEKIKDLFQFTNLAKEDWAEAMKLFKSQEFQRVFIHHEPGVLLLYKNLIKGNSTSQAMEEFLIAIHKKFKINIGVEKTEFQYTVRNESFMDKVVLTKDNWGHLEMKVTTDVPFIALEHKIVWADNFIGNNYNLEFVIHPEYIRNGKNFGRIFIKTIYQTITVEIVCIAEKAHKTENYQKEKAGQLEVIYNYLDFRTDHICLEKYITDSEEILDRLSLINPKDEKYEMLRTHLYITDQREEKVKQMLHAFEAKADVLKEKSVVYYCGYLYLNALYSKDIHVIEDALECITQLYEREYHGFELLWFLFYLDKKYENNQAQKLNLIKEQTEAGCHSPILYYEAVSAFNKEPSLLHELGAFEVQILNFGIRKDYLSDDAAIQYTYLASREKEFKPLIYQGLVMLYEKYKSKDILGSICAFLIKGQKSSKKYFKWFQMGVEAQLKITQLHEYYMYSINEEEEPVLPTSVLLYFMYNSNLADYRKAYLYASIIRNKEKNASVYRTYLKQIENFGLKQITAHNLNHNLAIIYQEVIDKNSISDRLAKELPHILFKYQIKCSNPKIKGVVVVHQELKDDTYVPLHDGEAQICIFTENTEILLVDYHENRYAATIEYSLEKLMPTEEYLNQCYSKNKDNPMLLLALSDKMDKHLKLDQDSMNICKRLMELSILSSYYRRKCQMYLTNYFYDNYEGDLLETYLLSVDLHHVEKKERNNLIEFTIIRDLYPKALEEIKKYGYQGILPKRLLKLCSKIILSGKIEGEEDILLNLCHYVFQSGKYDDTILKYLVKFYFGSTKEMFELWKEAKEFEIDTTELEERLLGQILFAESYVSNVFDIFLSYYKKGSNRKLIRAFLNFYSYKYLMYDSVVQNEFFDVIKRELVYEENEIAMLALLKNFCYRGTLTKEECHFADYNIHQFIERGIVLPFFKGFKDKINLPGYICDKFYVQYIGDPSHKPSIHYRLIEHKKEDFIVEKMKNVYLGIHVKEFVLFYNEELQYYITENTEGEGNITESMVITLDSDIEEEEENKYNAINLMLMTKDIQDEKTLIEMMEQYIKNQYISTHLFHIL